MSRAKHEAAGSRVSNSQPDEHDELRRKQNPVPQRRAKRMLQARAESFSLARSDIKHIRDRGMLNFR